MAQADEKPPGRIDGKMHLGPLVRYYTCLAISRVSSLAAFDGGQKTQNESLPSEGEKADFFLKKTKSYLSCA
jgi:hypothetical protein